MTAMHYDPAVDVTGPNQTRTTAWDDALIPFADALEAVLGSGAHDLPSIVQGLNDRGFMDPSGIAWTPDTLSARLAELDR